MNSWKPESFYANEIESNIKEKKFVVPRFQRGIVWKQEQRDLLIDSIKKGLPFGTILLYKDEIENNYSIIDGLQRCYTVCEFVNNPAQFFKESDIDDLAIARIVSMIGANGNVNAMVDRVKDLLIQWIKEINDTMQKVENMQYFRFAKVLSDNFPTLIGKEVEVIEIIEPQLQSYKDICKSLLSIKIPAIIIEGDEDVLPIIFERINSSGTKLSKYEIYAATWINKFTIPNLELIEIVKKNRDRYDEMLEGTLELDGYDSAAFLNNKELNAFEVAFGFGKYVSEKYNHLFVCNSDINQVESIGFNLINSCLCSKVSEIKNMNFKIQKLVGSDITMFLIRILESIKFVDKIISKFNKFKSNRRSESCFKPLHTEYQIVSIISSVFLSRYANIELDGNGNLKNVEIHPDQSNQTWSSNENKFKSNMPKRYILDILNQRWSGTGDKRLDSILLNNDCYTKYISFEDFSDNLKQWFNMTNDERNEYRKVTAPKEAEKILLTIVYLTEFSAMDHLNETKYDIEHLATKNLLKKQLDRFEGDLKLPISSMGNLCLLPEKENRSKREHTIYNDEKYMTNSTYSLSDLENKFTFTVKDDLEWLYDNALNKDEVKTKYYEFINKRLINMLGKIESNFSKI